MSESARDSDELVGDLFRTEYTKIVAVLTSAFGFPNLDVAEDLAQETLLAALHDWPLRGTPDQPEAWLMRVAKNKALNLLKHDGVVRRATERQPPDDVSEAPRDVFLRTDVEDSTLRMVFACCHPDLGRDDQLALILKVLCGLGAREMAAALLLPEDTVNKRIYRAKKRAQEAGIRFELPGGEELATRLEPVCRSLYLLFNEGYSSTESDELVRKDLCFEAMRLCRHLVDRFPDQPPIFALMSLMCLHAARFDTRVDAAGALVLFADQDRSRWDRDLIRSGVNLLHESARGDVLTTYHLEASIAALHCSAPSLEETDWSAVGRLYEQLHTMAPNPVVRLNLAIVSSRTRGTEAAIRELERLRSEPRLARYPLLFASLATFYEEVGRSSDAAAQFSRARELTRSAPMRAFLDARLRGLQG